MKKNQKILLIAMIIIVIVIVVIELYFKLLFNDPLYSCSYVNFNMGGKRFGYIIYYNGIIIKYDDYNKDKKGKISKDELKKLKNLANSVKDEYKKLEKGSGISDFDVSDCAKEVYSTRLKKWVILFKSGDRVNSSKESKEIQDFAEVLYNKYVK